METSLWITICRTDSLLRQKSSLRIGSKIINHGKYHIKETDRGAKLAAFMGQKSVNSDICVIKLSPQQHQEASANVLASLTRLFTVCDNNYTKYIL